MRSDFFLVDKLWPFSDDRRNVFSGMAPFIDWIQTWWPALLAFVIGATPFGFLAAKMKGIDIRDHGSGNIGATNVLRVLGKPIGIPVFILDVLKGSVPVLIAMQVSDNIWVAIASAIAAVLGHNYTFWLRFKGGKGIATTAGALLPLMPVTILCAVVIWFVVLKVTRYVSVASITAAASLPVSLSLTSFIQQSWNWPIVAFGSLLGLLAIWKHRSNIDRLRRGEENRIAPKSKTNHART